MKQREIKFRAWYKGAEYPLDKNNLDDHEKPQMIYNVQLLYDGMGVDKNSVLGGHSCFGSLLNEDQFNIMQFTGLLDKNSKEIYEGDIINISEEYKPMVITWSKRFASFCIEKDGWVFQHWFGESCDPDKAEVIGNIYESPELLK